MYFLQQNRQIDCGREYLHRSQTHEYGNWDCGRAISFLGIFISKFRYQFFAVWTRGQEGGVTRRCVHCNTRCVHCNTEYVPGLLVLVESLEVAGNDGDGEGEHQHPRYGAECAHQLTQSSRNRYFICTEAFIYVRYSFLLISNKFCVLSVLHWVLFRDV
jgi:hypothetical protein